MEAFVCCGSLGLAATLMWYGGRANKEKRELVWFAGISLIVVFISWVWIILSFGKGYILLIPLGLMGIFSYLAGRVSFDVGNWISAPGGLEGILAILLMLFLFFSFKLDNVSWYSELTNRPSQIVLEEDHAVLVESRAPLGSWFNRDSVKFGLSEVVFIDKFLIFESSTAFPYSKIEEIEIKDGQIWNDVGFAIKGKWLNKRKKIYFTSDASMDDLRIITEGLKKDNIVIIENKSLLKSVCNVLRGNHNGNKHKTGLK